MNTKKAKKPNVQISLRRFLPSVIFVSCQLLSCGNPDPVREQDAEIEKIEQEALDNFQKIESRLKKYKKDSVFQQYDSLVRNR
jgi:hypothetical protein